MATVATVALIWLPIGTAMLGVIEEWDLLAMFTKHGVFFLTSLNSLMPALALRPLSIAPQALAYVLGPNSFLSWHALLAISLTVKAFAMGYVIWWSLRDRSLAVLGGLLFLLYPADTMQMTLRAMHIDWAVAAVLGGVALILASTETRGVAARWGFAVLGGICFLLGSLTYEAGLLMAPAPALLWWARHGLLRGLRTLQRQAVPLLAWGAAAVAAVGYMVVISRSGGLYQQSIGTVPTSFRSLLHDRLPLLFTVGMYREFVHGWYDAARIFAESQRFWPYLAVLMVIVIGTIAALRHHSVERRGNFRTVGRLIVAGFLLACLGFTPYLSSPAHILITQRTHLYSAIGGALATTFLLFLVTGRSQFARACCWTAVLALGLCAQWNQLAHYTTLSLRARAMLAGILETAPNVPAGGHFLIIDQSGQLQSTWMMRGGMLENALTYLYGHSVVPMVCVEPDLTWSTFAVDAAGRPGKCVEHATDWEIGVGGPGAFTWAKQDLLVLHIAPDGTVQRASNELPPAVSPAEVRRWTGILRCWPASDCVYHPPLRELYFFDFGRWWSLEDAPWGAGWRDTEWVVPAWQPISFAWINASQSRLWVPLTPSGGRYRFRMRAFMTISTEAKDSLTASINGHNLTLDWVGSNLVEAPVPAEALKRGLNELLFSSKLHPDYGISVAVDWVSIAPE